MKDFTSEEKLVLDKALNDYEKVQFCYMNDIDANIYPDLHCFYFCNIHTIHSILNKIHELPFTEVEK